MNPLIVCKIEAWRCSRLSLLGQSFFTMISKKVQGSFLSLWRMGKKINVKGKQIESLGD